jgi:hypothetical protein
MTNPLDQHGIDLKALREKGFSNLPQSTRDRLMNALTPEQVAADDERAERQLSRKVGDLVGLDTNLASGGAKFRGVTFKVVKVNAKTYKLQPLNGGLMVNADKFLVTDPPVTTTPAGTAQDVPLHDPIEHLVAGTLVRVHNGKHDRDWLNDGDLGVVLVDKGERVNVAPLGGYEDRYGRLPRRMLTVVDPKSLVEKPF